MTWKAGVRRWLAPSRPWHLVLAPALPLIALYAANTAMAPPRVLLWPMLVSTALAGLLWLGLLALVRDGQRAAFAATLVIIASLSYVTLLRLALVVSVPWLVPIIYVGIGCLVLRTMLSSAPARLTGRINTVLLLTIVLLVLPIGWGEIARTKSRTAPVPPGAAPPAAPDVYVLVMDGYARHDVLRDKYAYDNDLTGALRARGFVIPGRATANYSHTAHSLASALNLDYLPALGFPAHPDGFDRRGLADVIEDSRFFRAFAAAGYHIRAYESEYAVLRPRQADERPGPFWSVDDFGLAVYETSAVPVFSQWLGFDRSWVSAALHRRHVLWTLDHLRRTPVHPSRPNLVFLHVLAPHPPFVFNADGSPRPTRLPAVLQDGSLWQQIARGSGERYRDGYTDAVRVLNARVVLALDELMRRQRRPAVFLIHSDHGPGSDLEWEDAEATDMRERLGILAAIRFPGDEAPPVPDDATLVNVYRAVMNRALGLALPPLENRAFFSTWSKPFDYVDVTDRISKATRPAQGTAQWAETAENFSHGGTEHRRRTEATGRFETTGPPRARRPSVGGRRGEKPER